MRIRVPSKKGDKAYFSSLREHFSNLPGVSAIEVNPLTGSLLFFLNGSDKDIPAGVARSDFFTIGNMNEPVATLSEKAIRSFDALDDQVKSFAGGELDISSLALLALFGMGAYQILMGNLTAPAWYVAFWYAGNIALGTRAENLLRTCGKK